MAIVLSARIGTTETEFVVSNDRSTDSDFASIRATVLSEFNSDLNAEFLQAVQGECLGIVRKSSISVMTRRLRLEPLAPEGEADDS
jgi:hypothetical protein